jgi:hypothetical protein
MVYYKGWLKVKHQHGYGASYKGDVEGGNQNYGEIRLVGHTTTFPSPTSTPPTNQATQHPQPPL